MPIPSFEEFRKQKYGDAYDGPYNGVPQAAPSGGMDPEQMKKLFLMESLRNPKQASALGTIFDKFIKPAKQTAADAKRETKTMDIDRGLAEITSARNALKKSGSGPQYTGFGIRQKLGKLGFLSKDATDANSALSNVNTQLFQIAGTQFPKNEEALLGGIVLNLLNDMNSNTSALGEAEKRLKRQKQLLSTGVLDEETDTRPSLDDIFGGQ